MYLIMTRFKRYKLRSYIVELITAFDGVERMPDLGKNVKWPTPPVVLRPLVEQLKKVHIRWRAKVIRSKMPALLRESLPEKLAAIGVMRGKRDEWGYIRSWKGDYLSMAEEVEPPSHPADYLNTMTTLKQKHPFNKVLFSSYFSKFNRHHKTAHRVIVITEAYVIKLNAEKFKIMQSPIPLESITQLSISNESNGLVVLHHDKNDMVCYLRNNKDEDRVGEIVGVLCSQFERFHSRKLPVVIAPSLSCVLGEKKYDLCLLVDPNSKQTTVFKNSGAVISVKTSLIAKL
ncbi:hypothetical protein AB6A40_002568 [Gnathostoma spinigerum]|uniref:TH1 domain-containing protein n=1 Tax=Gnathostoma spinigerum TaxID=75299 RepID=A0ABD6EES7_9BILA